MTGVQRGFSKVALFAVCITPFILVVMRAVEVMGMSLGPNPVTELLHTMGKTSLNILLITLTISPARRLTKINALVIYRRMLGLFSFFYLVVHFCAYAVLDLGLAWSTLYVDITQRPYITVGMLALALMIPLAVTSTRGMQRRLKRKWLTLHRTVYAIGILAVTHYMWQTKLDLLEPLIYSLILAILLGERLARRLHRRHVNAHRPA